MNGRSDRAIHALASLDDPLRARIYEMVRAGGVPATRENISSQAKISKALATFHLEKLLERGLLRAHYARPPGRSGPGAGRTAKYYEASATPIDVSIPPRRYDLAGKVLARAIEGQREGETAAEAAHRIAFDRGSDLGARLRAERDGAEATDVLERALERHGFEPGRTEDEVVLRNCPFSDLAREAPSLICGMNQRFLSGLVEGFGAKELKVAADTAPERCCAKLLVEGARRNSLP